MNEVKLQANRREPGRSNARSLRRQGIVPGIFYFHGENSIPIATTELALRPLIYTSESHLINLVLDNGEEKLCILKVLDFDPITDRPVHFDLQGVARGESIKVEVPVNLVGKSPGQSEGGLVQFMMHKLEIESLPKDLPEHIDVDISALNIGDSIHVSDLSVENITILTSADSTIVSITPPRVAEEEEETGLEGDVEPEVISKGKADDEEE